LALGLGLAFLGFAGYVLQLSLRNLMAPWYLPIVTTLGALLLVVALWQARTVWRVLALVPVLLLAGGSWTLLLGSRLPPYSGPVALGKPFPAFETKRADGRTFSQSDLEGDQKHILVFFRGRW
jgi:hypothetical protein